MTTEKFCECPSLGDCCRGRGPQMIEVTRAGKRLKLCSRCDLSSDTDRVLLVKPTDPNLATFDPIFVFVVAGYLGTEDDFKAQDKYKLKYPKAWQRFWKANAKKTVKEKTI